MATFHRIFPITFDDFHFFFDFFFALYTNSFVRSFASSINITGSSLVISHNRACNFITEITGFELVCHIRRAQPPTNPPNGGGLFHATAATKPGCAGAGSGERHDETEQTHF